MGWRDAPIIKGAPEALQQPTKPTELPGFRGAVAGAETTATETVKAGLKPKTEAATAGLTAPIPTQSIYQDLTAAKSQVNSVEKQLNRVEQIYNRSLKGVEPWRVAREYFPSIAPTSSVSKDVGRFVAEVQEALVDFNVVLPFDVGCLEFVHGFEVWFGFSW